jgi:hypothetical protein
MRAEGKEYVVQDGDVMNFLFNVWSKARVVVAVLEYKNIAK